jgi:hypothetical protein
MLAAPVNPASSNPKPYLGNQFTTLRAAMGGYVELLSDVDSVADQKMKALTRYSDSLDTLFDGYANRFVY